MAAALVLPLVSAFNCTPLYGEEYKVCNYIEDTNWRQSEKNEVISNMINSGGLSLDGEFESTLNRPVEDGIQLNRQEKIELKISEENKEFLIDFSSISIFGYLVFSFLKRYYLLLNIL